MSLPPPSPQRHDPNADSGLATIKVQSETDGDVTRRPLEASSLEARILELEEQIKKVFDDEQAAAKTEEAGEEASDLDDSDSSEATDVDADSRGTPNVDVDTKSDIEPCIVLPRTPSAPKPHQSPVLRGPRLAKGLLRRGPRACCRILFDYGVNIQELAKKYKKSEEYINRVVENDSPIPDNVDEDYASVDVEMREVYPPKPGPRLSCSKLKRGRGVFVNRRATKRARTETVGAPEYTLLSNFLATLSPPLPRLLDILQGQHFDDNMLRAVLTWSATETEELLKELVGAGIMTVLDMFVVRRGLERRRRALIEWD